MRSGSNRGGKRDRAGRPKGGKYKEPTDSMRVPTRSIPYLRQLVDSIWLFLAEITSEENLLPLIFHDLTTALAESVKSRVHGKESVENNGVEQTSQSNLVPFPLIEPVQRKPLTRDQRSKMYPSAIAASFGVTSTSEQDNPGKQVDLHQMLVKDPTKTFFLPVAGDSMNKAGIHDGDLVVVQRLTDSWSQLKNSTIVTALVDGIQTVKRFEKIKGKAFLIPESDNPEHQPLELRGGMDIDIFGIVMYSIHPTSKRRAF